MRPITIASVFARDSYKFRVKLLHSTVKHIIQIASPKLGKLNTDIGQVSENEFLINSLVSNVMLEFKIVFTSSGVNAEVVDDKKFKVTWETLPFGDSYHQPSLAAPSNPAGIYGPSIYIKSSGRTIKFFYGRLLAGQVEGVVLDKNGMNLGHFKNVETMIEKAQVADRPKLIPIPKKPAKGQKLNPSNRKSAKITIS